MIFHCVSDDCLKNLRLILERKNDLARALGVTIFSIMEQELKILKAIDNPPSPESMLRLGALTHEGHNHKQFFFQRIEALHRDQARVGEAGLRELGLDPDKEELTIDMSNGVVSRLESGEWKPVPKEIQA